VRADDPNLKRLTPPKLTLLERTYLPQIVEGLAVTGKHIAGVVIGGRGNPGVLFGGKGRAITVEYPEDQHITPPNYRGVHRLNKDEQGRVKCVACMLCATACPAHCIDIVGATAPETWDDREKYPESFVIDELRCIYCGMCEEACPVDAIELTGLYDLTGLSREQMIFDKTKLLSVFDMTKDAEPMRTGNPSASLPVPTRPQGSTAPGPPAETAPAAAIPVSSPQDPSP
jgi:NADH-quinone oxidoreductase subunit I